MPNEFEPQYGEFPKSELTVYPSGGGVPGLKALQALKSKDLATHMLGKLHTTTKPVSDWFASTEQRLQKAQADLDAAQAAIADGLDEGEVSALIEAHTNHISASVSKNAADIAEMGVTIAGATADAVAQSVAAVTQGMNSVLQGAAGAAGQIADSFATAFNRMVNALTGKNLGYWDAEVYVASGNVYEGTNDTPLGIYKGFNGEIDTLVARVVSVTQLGETPASLTVNVLVNGHVKGSVNLTGTAVKVVSKELNIRMDAGDIITFTASGVTGEYIGLSVSVAGVYL